MLTQIQKRELRQGISKLSAGQLFSIHVSVNTLAEVRANQRKRGLAEDSLDMLEMEDQLASVVEFLFR